MINNYNKNIDIAIVTAMDIEMKYYHNGPFSSITKDNITYRIAQIGQFSVVFLVTEIGLTNAAAKTAALITEFDPKWLFFSGIAGALQPNLKLGDVVLGKLVFSVEMQVIIQQFQHKKPRYGAFSPATFTTDPQLLSLAESASFSFPVHTGILASSDHFPAPPSLREELSNKKATSIDMESSGFSHACTIFNKPCLCVRGMSNYLSAKENIMLEHDDVCNASKNAAEVVNKCITLLEQTTLQRS